MLFRDRTDAGRQLAQALLDLRGQDVVVLALPRGGVPVAAEVARLLGAPLDVLLVRKLGVPLHRELAMGAIGEGGVRVINDALVQAAGISDADLAQVQELEAAELARRGDRYREGRGRARVAGRPVVVVDDGVATGSTALAACAAARALGAARVIVAAPVASRDAVRALKRSADAVVCLATPVDFRSVGEHYADFSQTSDDEVLALLRAGRSGGASRPRQVTDERA